MTLFHPHTKIRAKNQFVDVNEKELNTFHLGCDSGMQNKYRNLELPGCNEGTMDIAT